MRLDYVIYRKSTFSNPTGYLELLENGDVTYTKYKNQLQGRLNILLWIIYNIALSFMNDKMILSLAKGDVKSSNLKKGKVGTLGLGGAYNEITLKAADKDYTFYIDNDYDYEKIEKFVNSIK